MDEGAAVHHVALNDRSIVGEQSTQLLRLAARQAADEHLGGLQDKASITPDYYGQSGGAASFLRTVFMYLFFSTTFRCFFLLLKWRWTTVHLTGSVTSDGYFHGHIGSYRHR